eukprot:7664417-Karenia_brevis.AAC.1
MTTMMIRSRVGSSRAQAIQVQEVLMNLDMCLLGNQPPYWGSTPGSLFRMTKGGPCPGLDWTT